MFSISGNNNNSPQSRGTTSLLLAVVSLILLVPSLAPRPPYARATAQYSASLVPQVLNDYFIHDISDETLPAASLLLEGVSPPLDESDVFLEVAERSREADAAAGLISDLALGGRGRDVGNNLSPITLGYLVDEAKSNEIAPMSSQLVDYLAQLKRQQQIYEINSKTDAANYIIDSLVNKQNRPSLMGDNAILGPVNDPADFDDTLFPGTNMSVILSQLAPSIYLGSHVVRQASDKVEQQRSSSSEEESEKTGETSNKVSGKDSDESGARSGGGEYIDHPLAIIGHQYMQGGAGEGRQLLGPDGTFENVQVVKSDHAVPSYCDPPNPCPIGYTNEDGCLEQFVNSASFSREYQAKQQCSCDNEHSLFNCAPPVVPSLNKPKSNDNNLVTISLAHQQADDDDDNNHRQAGEDGAASFNSIHSQLLGLDVTPGEKEKQHAADVDKLDTLARTINNRFGSLNSVRDLIAKHEQELAQRERDDPEQQHNFRVAKKAPKQDYDFRF